MTTYSDDYLSYWFLGNRFEDGFEYRDGQYVDACYEYASSAVPPDRVRTFRESDFDSHTACVQGAIDFWNAQQGGAVQAPELAAFLSHVSTKYNIGNVFDLGSTEHQLFAPEWLCECNGNAPLFIGASCHAGDFATAQTAMGGLPLCERLLLTERAIGFVGPTTGTSQRGNREILRAFVERLYEGPGRPMAESFRLARQDVREQFAAETDIIKTVDSYVFLGDPLSPFNPGNYAIVGAGEDNVVKRATALWVRPNPAGGPIALGFASEKRGHAQLAVYNVAGRLVRVLLEGRVEAGERSLVWDGTNAAGRMVGAGVYWARLKRPEGQVENRRFVRLR